MCSDLSRVQRRSEDAVVRRTGRSCQREAAPGQVRLVTDEHEIGPGRTRGLEREEIVEIGVVRIECHAHTAVKRFTSFCHPPVLHLWYTPESPGWRAAG